MDICSEMNRGDSMGGKGEVIIQSPDILSLLILLFSMSFLASCGGGETDVNTDASLSSIEISGSMAFGELTPAFSPDITEYTVAVPDSADYDVETLDITATATNPDARVLGWSGEGSRVQVIAFHGLSNTDFSYIIKTVAADGVTKGEYTVHFDLPELSNDASLSSIGISGSMTFGELTPAFDPDVTDYTVAVPFSTDYDAESLDITATATNVDAIVFGWSGDGSRVQVIDFTGLTNTDFSYTIETLAADGVTTGAYTIHFDLPQIISTTNDASLSSIVLSGSMTFGELSPAFDPAITGYTVAVPFSADYDSEILDIIATATNPDALVFDWGGTGSRVQTISFHGLSNTDFSYTIETLAADGVTTGAYTVHFDLPALSNDASLSSIQISGSMTFGELSPAFDPAVTDYTVTVPFSADYFTESLDITATATNADAVVFGWHGDGSQVKIIDFTGLSNTDFSYTIDSLAADGVTTGAYTIDFLYEPPPNADLSALSATTVTGSVSIPLKPGFSAGLLNYTGVTSNENNQITITAKVDDASSTVTVDGVITASGAVSHAIDLIVGENSIPVVVTASDGVTTKQYMLQITREVPHFSVSGFVSGLAGTLVLQNNLTNDLSTSIDGSITFTTGLADGEKYDITVSSHPTGQTCSVDNASGVIAGANIINVNVSCVDDVVSYTVGGTVSDLTGTLILQNNAGDDLSLLADGSFAFVSAIADGTGYAVTVSSSPAGQSCIVTNGSGSIAGANVTNVSVACSDVVSTPAGIFIEPMSLYASSASALGDVNGDGDLDLVAAWGETTVWLNNGLGGLVDSGQVLGSSIGSLELGDVDGDGDLDLVMAAGISNTVWFNDGQGVFSDSGQTLGAGAGGIALGDIDGDGDLDLVVAYEYGSFNGSHNVWLNNGAGVFSVESGLDFGTWERIQSIALGDVDGDGDLDLVEVCAYCPERIWLNNGFGTFTNSGQELGTDNTRSVVLGDIDGDGDLDMVKANGNGGNPVWLNDGDGIFTDSGQSLVSVTNSTYSLALSDVDDDGDLDLMEANGDGAVNTFNSLWFNDGNGIFTDSDQSFHTANAAGSALFGDMDGDGDLDLVMDHALGTMSVWINSGVGVFTDSIQFLDITATQSVVLGDIDGDGDLDLVEGNYAELAYYDKVPNTIKLNNGDGSFTDSGQELGAAETNSVALGDVDGDNDLDLVAGNNIGSNKVWLNDGVGVFTDSGQVLGDNNNSTTWSVALGDVDGDGDLDLVAGNLKKLNTVWLNDGVGLFTLSEFLGEPYSNSTTRSLFLGDVDGDGDLDLVEGNSNSEPNTVWLNDGAGLFTDSGQTLGSNNTYALALSDVDGDGDLDLVEGNYGTEPNTIWFNNGAGIFTDSGQTLGARSTNSVTLGDVDGDGDLDLVAGNYLEPDTVWINSGMGTFTDSGHALGYYYPLSNYLGTQSVTLGDVDDDGDLDLVTGTYGGSQPNAIYLNQTP